MQERKAASFGGGLALLLWLVAWVISVYYIVQGGKLGQIQPQPVAEIGRDVVIAVVAFFAGCVLLKGVIVIQPNDARVLQFFGKYAGTVRDTGLRWVNPLTSKRSVSLKARNFETQTIKVNDIDGNPIEIAAVITWRVADTYKALFDIEDFSSYVQKQSEAAIRNLATHYPYDTHTEGTMSLRGATDKVAAHLEEEINKRILPAGVEIVDARIAHLAYAQEIAQAMLQRQQAGAIIAARTLIVEGAVSMVEMALAQLSARNIVELDAERKAAMVSNLLVVLCGERGTQPVVNTGSLY
jgi:regulator of protease activity HflC (stomatin/prohibitin superfamily)